MSKSQHNGIIAWFARNPVAANLLMIVIMVVGLASVFNIQRAIFPALEIDILRVTMAYPGAAPEEVEKGIVDKIEEAINDVDGIKRVTSTAFESMASGELTEEENIARQKRLLRKVVRAMLIS